MARRLCRLSKSGVRSTVLRTAALVALAAAAAQAQIYVSPDGLDANPGTFEQPYLTITQAHSVAVPGDTIYLRGGVYDSLLTTITLSKSGSRSSRYYLMAYPGERPLLDFSLMSVSSSNRGIRLSGIYWHIKGLDIRGAGDNGMHVSGSYNTIEFCSFLENRDTGLQLSSGASNNEIINCDSYWNADTTGENADGFAVKLDVGTGNSLRGCRAWENCDDGFDGYLRGADGVVTSLDSCWFFKNGYLKNGSPSLPNGDGNGFKMGGSDDKTLRHQITLRNCVAFDNRVRGFDQNSNKGSMTLQNCSAYRNGTNYSIATSLAVGETATVINGVALGSAGSLGAFVIQQTNSWLAPFSVTAADFLSIDTSGVRGPRNADGSLPDVAFLHLAPGSDLIDAGTDVGIPYSGAGPDLGAFESEPPTATAPPDRVPTGFRIVTSYPNPFNPSTAIVYEVPGQGTVTITIVDLLGRSVQSSERVHGSAGTYRAFWNGTDEQGLAVASGTYFAVLQFKELRSVVRLQLLH